MTNEQQSVAQNCSTCTHWDRLRVNANWGRCLKIVGINKALANTAQAYVHAIGSDVATPIGVVELNTRDVFYCSHHEGVKLSHPNSLVEAVQEASRKHAGIKEEK